MGRKPGAGAGDCDDLGEAGSGRDGGEEGGKEGEEGVVHRLKRTRMV